MLSLRLDARWDGLQMFDVSLFVKTSMVTAVRAYAGDGRVDGAVAICPTLEASGSLCEGNLVLCGETARCADLIARGDHLLIGISPFNSRFSPAYVSHMLRLGVQHFERVDVLLPDERMATLLPVARGMEQLKAERKVRKEIGRHLRSLDRVLEQEGLRQQVSVSQFSDFSSMPAYRDVWRLADDAMRLDAQFRCACTALTAQAIMGSASADDGAGAPGWDAISYALPYVLAEMPFYVASPLLFDVASSAFSYHRSWPIASHLRDGQGSVRIHPGQAHGIFSYRQAPAASSIAGGRRNVSAH